jgi:glycosyltransferase involved in cell wall biosynthesis
MIKKTALYQNQTQGKPNYDVSVQVTIPNEWENLAPVNIGVTAGIETNKVAPLWIEKANHMNKIITISNHSKQTFLDTVYDAVNNQTGQKVQLRCVKDIEVVHYPVKQFDDTDLKLKLDTDFNFLTVAQWGPRKNLENTIKWFIEEFIDIPEVGLVVKTFQGGNSILDRHYTTKLFNNLLSKYKERKCKVYLLHGDMSDKEMHSLYKHPKIKALVSLTHGEGFGLPLFEAAYSGLPVMAPEWSGHVDFLFAPKKNKKVGNEKMKAHFAKIDYDVGPVPDHAVWENVIEKGSMWCYPQQGSYKMRLREVYKEHGRFKKQALKLQKWVLENFEEKKQYDTLLKNLVPNYKDPLTDKDFDVEAWLEDMDVQVSG